jgi:magnesium transporter
VTEVLYGLDDATSDRIAALRAEGRFFWLDASLDETTRDDLRDALEIPERALSALPPSGDSYATRAVLADGESVIFTVHCYVDPHGTAVAAGRRLRPIRVHVVVTGEYILTLHEERISLPAALALDPQPERGKGYVVYSVLDAMLSSTFSALEDVELMLDGLAATWTEGRGDLPRATLRDTGVTLAQMRRWVTAEQAVLERVGVEIAALPGFGTGDERLFDRLGEEVDRLLASIDAVANGMGMLLDLQLNERAYVVSILGSIFVPLTLVTGYFGMNFGWLVDHIDSPVAFWLLGVILPIASGLVSWWLVRRFLMGGGRRRSRGGGGGSAAD